VSVRLSVRPSVCLSVTATDVHRSSRDVVNSLFISAARASRLASSSRRRSRRARDVAVYEIEYIGGGELPVYMFNDVTSVMRTTSSSSRMRRRPRTHSERTGPGRAERVGLAEHVGEKLIANLATLTIHSGFGSIGNAPGRLAGRGRGEVSLTMDALKRAASICPPRRSVGRRTGSSSHVGPAPPHRLTSTRR